MSTENSTPSFQRVFVILDENGVPVLRTPLFIDYEQDDESIKNSLIEWFSRYTEFNHLIAREISNYDFNAEGFPFVNLKEPKDIIFECDPNIRDNEKQIIRDKMKYENYRNNAVDIYEKYLKRKEIKKKWQKKN